MADPAIAAAARATFAGTQNGSDRREHGGKRQRTDAGDAPATISTTASTGSPTSSSTEASVNTIADFIDSLADYEPTVRLHSKQALQPSVCNTSRVHADRVGVLAMQCQLLRAGVVNVSDTG